MVERIEGGREGAPPAREWRDVDNGQAPPGLQDPPAFIKGGTPVGHQGERQGTADGGEAFVFERKLGGVAPQQVHVAPFVALHPLCRTFQHRGGQVDALDRALRSNRGQQRLEA